MKLACAALFVVAMSLNAAGNGDIAGKWEAKYVSGIAWKTIGSAEFEFQTEGTSLTGVAHVGSGYPGTAPISMGKIDGDRISFTVVGEHASWGSVPCSSGIPKMKFRGAVHGDEIELTMVLYYCDVNAATRTTELKGKRIP